MTTATATDGPICPPLVVSDVRIKLAAGAPGLNGILLGFASVVLNGGLCVRDLKILQAGDGRRFVAMPSRALCDRCPGCRGKAALVARFCPGCGRPLATDRHELDRRGRPKLHADVAHPIHPGAREALEAAVLAAYDDEVALSTLPGYVPSWGGWDDGEDGGAS